MGIVVMAMVAGLVVGVIMRVAVVVAIKCQCAFCPLAKQRAIFGGRSDMLRLTLTTNMAIQTDHPITGAHHHMQIMTNHQNSTAQLLPHIFNLPVKSR